MRPVAHGPDPSRLSQGQMLAMARPLCTPERQSLCESHRQRRWLTHWSYLEVLDTAERTQIDQRVPQQFHAVVSLLDAFKTEQQPLELVLPGKGPIDTQA